MSEKMFYVYVLSDPRDGAPFYVGKGKGLRAWQHAADVRKGILGCNKAKVARIASIQADGAEPEVEIAYRTDCEQDAYDTEADLIASTAGLTNIMAGGGRGLTPLEAANRAAEREMLAVLRKKDKTREWLRGWLATVEAWAASSTFPGLKDGDAKARQFVEDVRGLVGSAT